MRTSTSTERRPASWSERGATMVEFALIAALLFSIVFAIIEGAFAVRARSSLENAVDEAARRGAVAGTDPRADFLILQTFKERGIDRIADIKTITVYSTTNGGDLPNPLCIGDGASSQPGFCNVYGPDDLDRVETDFGCASALDTPLCPENRGGSQTVIRFLGVWVETEYKPIIGAIAFPLDFPMQADGLLALENSGEDS